MNLKPEATVFRGVPLRERTTFRIGGRAEEFYAPATVEEMRVVLEIGRAHV